MLIGRLCVPEIDDVELCKIAKAIDSVELGSKLYIKFNREVVMETPNKFSIIAPKHIILRAQDRITLIAKKCIRFFTRQTLEYAEENEKSCDSIVSAPP